MQIILQTNLDGVPETFPMRELHENQAPQRWGATTLVLPTYTEYNNGDRLSLSLLQELPCFDLSTDELNNTFTYEITPELTNALAEFLAPIEVPAPVEPAPVEPSSSFRYFVVRVGSPLFLLCLGAINWFTQRLPQQVFNTPAIGFQNTTNDFSTLNLEPPTHFNNFFGYPQCTDAISCPNTAFETLPRQEHVNERITLQPVVRLIIIVFGLFLSFVLIFRPKSAVKKLFNSSV